MATRVRKGYYTMPERTDPVNSLRARMYAESLLGGEGYEAKVRDGLTGHPIVTLYRNGQKVVTAYGIFEQDAWENLLHQIEVLAARERAEMDRLAARCREERLVELGMEVG